LIENSIAKAELGVKIAGEMDTSLREIVDGIVESSQISNEIAVGADRQAAAIMEITTGIDQVAQVVQQNSATAEESAAASEELSGQSAILNNLIGQFRLSGAAGKYASFAQGAQKKPEHVISLEHPSADKFGAYDKY
jgi:methyl-accepting chemotaxis protein